MPGKNRAPKSDVTLYKQLGQRMQQARQGAQGGKGYTQEELAKILDVTPITLSRWETGTRSPSFEMLEKFANEVSKPLSYFFEPEPQESDYMQILFKMAKDLDETDLKEIVEYTRYRYQRWYNEHRNTEES